MPPISLRHIHIPEPIPYILANAIQTHLISLHHKYRAATKSILSIPPSIPPRPPPPTLLTFSASEPTYTVGRRYLSRNPVPQSQIDYLTCTSSTPSTSLSSPHSTLPPKPLAHFYSTTRGGDLTYHAPGQLTAYPILNLRTHSLTARCYIALLERTVIRTAASFGVHNTTTTEDPGVWIRDSHDAVDSKATRKLAALGIRVGQGGLTSHGLGFNIHDFPLPQSFLTRSATYSAQLPPPQPPSPQPAAQAPPEAPLDLHSSLTAQAQGYLSWGFQRITACGLPGKTSTWLVAEAGRENSHSRTNLASPDLGLNIHDVAPVLAESLRQELNAWRVGQGRKGPETGQGGRKDDEDAMMISGIQRASGREIERLVARGEGILTREGVEAVL